VTCHQANGEGVPGTYPPLNGSEYATAANVEVPIRILMHGIQGPITVRGQQFSGLMPPYGVGIEMSNEEIASVLTYVRSSWGNKAGPVTPDDVAKVKSTTRTATGSMTAEELAPLMK
jgi:mono/diheme cytochrome c family protein